MTLSPGATRAELELGVLEPPLRAAHVQRVALAWATALVEQQHWHKLHAVFLRASGDHGERVVARFQHLARPSDTSAGVGHATQSRYARADFNGRGASVRIRQVFPPINLDSSHRGGSGQPVWMAGLARRADLVDVARGALKDNMRPLRDVGAPALADLKRVRRHDEGGAVIPPRPALISMGIGDLSACRDKTIKRHCRVTAPPL